MLVCTGYFYKEVGSPEIDENGVYGSHFSMTLSFFGQCSIEIAIDIELLLNILYIINHGNTTLGENISYFMHKCNIVLPNGWKISINCIQR